jgi:hypothetical protein
MVHPKEFNCLIDLKDFKGSSFPSRPAMVNAKLHQIQGTSGEKYGAWKKIKLIAH